jgi:hypothetical protein
MYCAYDKRRTMPDGMPQKQDKMSTGGRENKAFSY